MRVSVDSIDDPRLAPYRDLPAAKRDASSGRFVAESELAVRRLLESDFGVESVLATPSAASRLETAVPPGVPLFVAPRAALSRLVGYRFHSGVLACGVGRPLDRAPREWIEDRSPALIVALSDVVDVANVGSIVRSAAAFGARAVLLDSRCADPLSRQGIRVSVGNVFGVPIVRSEDLPAELLRLRESGGFSLHAAVADPRAAPLESAAPTGRDVVLVGGEGYGLRRELLDMADHRVTIRMRADVDSLNVAVASAIFLHRFAPPILDTPESR